MAMLASILFTNISHVLFASIFTTLSKDDFLTEAYFASSDISFKVGKW